MWPVPMVFWVGCHGSDRSDDADTAQLETGGATSTASSADTGTSVDPRWRALDGTRWTDDPGQLAGDVLVVEDLDGDGDAELAVDLPAPFPGAKEPGWTGAALFDGLPSSGPLEERATATWELLTEPWDVAGVGLPGDVTGDGVGDVVLYRQGYGRGEHLIYSGPGAGSQDPEAFQARVELGGGVPVRCGDLDGNGVDELCLDGLVFAGPVAPVVSADGWAFAVGGGPAGPLLGYPSLNAADLDGSGTNDLVVQLSSLSAPIAFFDPAFGLADVADADVTWTSGLVVSGRGTPEVDASGDVDGDGVPDVALLSWTGEQYDALVAPPGGGDLADSATRVEVPVEERANGAPHFEVHLAAGDLDGDGQDDLAVSGGCLPNRTLVFRGPLPAGTLDEDDADVVWIPSATFSGNCGPVVVNAEIGDLDGDGAGELVVAVEYGADGHHIVVQPRGGL